MSKKSYIILDARYKGYPHWKYCVPRPARTSIWGPWGQMMLYDSMQMFYKWRDWCWDTWGASKELSDWQEDLNHQDSSTTFAHNEHWCWINDSYNTRIYLRDEPELTLFLLKWA